MHACMHGTEALGGEGRGLHLISNANFSGYCVVITAAAASPLYLLKCTNCQRHLPCFLCACLPACPG